MAVNPLLPRDDRAEDAVIGSILIDPDALIRVQALGLEACEFAKPSNQAIFTVALMLWGRGQTVDYITVGNLLEDRHTRDGRVLLDAVGGRPELSRLITSTPTSVHAAHYAEIVRKTAFQRSLIQAAADITRMASDSEGKTRDELQQCVAERFGKSLQVITPTSHLYGTDENLTIYLARQQTRKERLDVDADAFVCTGWPSIDAMLTEIEPGMLHVVAARPRVGKTIYMECIAEHNAKHGKAVAFYHLELSHQAMLDRRMARHSGIMIDSLKRGYQGIELDRATDAMRHWQQRVTFIHCPGWSAQRIVADMVRLHAEGKCDVAIIDYLQRMPLPDKRGANESSMIAAVVSTLKDAAETQGMPIVLGCQVTRDLKTRGKKDARPYLTDLYGSGMIEAFTNQVIILHDTLGEDRSAADCGPIDVEVHLDKNTLGPSGMRMLRHIPGRFIFTEMAE